MDVTFVNSTGRLTITTQAPDSKAVFETLSELCEVFDETTCGVCQSQHIRFDVRHAQGFKFHRLKCRGCGARLDFGQHRDSETLFAKRRDDQGNLMPHSGWYHYQPEALDPDLQAIAAVKSRAELKTLVDRFNAEIKSGKLFNGRRDAILQAVCKRKAELPDVGSRAK